MQLLYALPFILLSLIVFVIFLTVPRLRRYAIQALVAPVAFGICSIGLVVVTVLAFAIVGQHIHLGTLAQSIAVGLGILVYLCGGTCGAWLAVRIVDRFDETLLKTTHARQFVIRSLIGVIAFGLVSFISMAVAEGVDPGSDSLREFILMAALSLFVGSLSGSLAYVLARKVQQRPLEPNQTSRRQEGT